MAVVGAWTLVEAEPEEDTVEGRSPGGQQLTQIGMPTERRAGIRSPPWVLTGRV